MTIRNYIKKGTIKAEKIGRRIIINSKDMENKLSKLNDKIDKLSVKSGSESVNSGSVTNAAIGTALTYGVQKMFAPQTLPATKKDLDDLKREMNEIKLLLKNIHLRKRKSDFSFF